MNELSDCYYLTQDDYEYANKHRNHSESAEALATVWDALAESVKKLEDDLGPIRELEDLYDDERYRIVDLLDLDTDPMGTVMIGLVVIDFVELPLDQLSLDPAYQRECEHQIREAIIAKTRRLKERAKG